jgi:hypothetical protein
MSRLEKIKEQHPELNVTIIDLLASMDPTDSYKYLEFLVKRLKNYYQEEKEQLGLHIAIDLIGTENTKTLNEYERHCKAKRVQRNDITKIETWKEMEYEVKLAEKIEEQKKIEKQVHKILDNDYFTILVPLSYESCKLYGSNTKWCITQENHWKGYSSKYIILFIIDKKTNKKIAISRKIGEKIIDAWDEEDVQTSPLLLNLPHQIMDVIVENILKDNTIQDLGKKYIKKEEPKVKEKKRQFTLDTYLPYLNVEEMFKLWSDVSSNQRNGNGYTYYYDGDTN